MSDESSLKVLNIGCGMASAAKLHKAFQGTQWKEVRFDIDPKVEPDLLGDMTDMRDLIATGTYDAIWSSHNIEHLAFHEAPLALQEFRRILNRDGFALINCPDIIAISQLIVEGKFEDPAYLSPAGPITPLDMLYGHSKSIAAGNSYMAHKTGFTQKRMGRMLLEAGFPEAWVFPGKSFDIWAVALMSGADRDRIRQLLTSSGLEFPK